MSDHVFFSVGPSIASYANIHIYDMVLKIRCSVIFDSISSPRPRSAVKLHDSQAYRNMTITKERISFTFDPKENLRVLEP